MSAKNKETIINLVSAVFSILIFLLIWQLATVMTTLGDLIPTPIAVITKLFDSLHTNIGKHTIIEHCIISLTRVLVGYIAACASGITLGLLMGWYPKVRAFFMPLFGIIRPIPPIAWTSLAILWFGLGELPKYFIIFIAAFCNVVINAFDGAKSTDKTLVGAAKMLGAKDSQIFVKVVLPSSVPYIFAGMQIALSNSWAAVVAAEMIRSNEGLGWAIISGTSSNNMEQIFVGIVMIGIVGLLLAAIMRGIEAKLCAWNKRAL